MCHFSFGIATNENLNSNKTSIDIELVFILITTKSLGSVC